jgi:hypothetical protein
MPIAIPQAPSVTVIADEVILEIDFLALTQVKSGHKQF